MKPKRNPVKSGAQFRLAEAVAHGKARATSMSKKLAKELLKKTPKALRSKFAKANPHRKRSNPRRRTPVWGPAYYAEQRRKKELNEEVKRERQARARIKKEIQKEKRRVAALLKKQAKRDRKAFSRNPAKRNPEASARAAYRDFHGKDPETVITVDTPRHYHGVLPGIGKLDFVSLYRPQGRAKGIKFSKGTYLCENEKRTQLFIVGGDQSVNLKDFGITHPHETEVLGEVSEIGYRTEKLHLIEKDGGKGLYVHKFSVPRPTLVYDVRNKLLSFAGGGYTIPSEGIDG